MKTERDENELVCVGVAEVIGETAKSWHVRLLDQPHTSWFPKSRCAWATDGCFHVPRWLLDRKNIQLAADELTSAPTSTSKPATTTPSTSITAARRAAALARAKALGWRVLDGGRKAAG